MRMHGTAKRWNLYNPLLGALVAMAWLLYFSASAPAQGQGGRQAPSGASNQPFDPRDLSGVWQPGPVRNAADPVMTLAGQAFLSKQRSEYSNPPVDGLE